MQEAVDAFLDLDEGAVIGQVADRALDDAAQRVAIGHAVPGVLLGLLDAQRDFLLFLVDAQHDDFDLFVELTNSLGWLIRRVHDISLMWTRPSMPSLSLTKAP